MQFEKYCSTSGYPVADPIAEALKKPPTIDGKPNPDYGKQCTSGFSSLQTTHPKQPNYINPSKKYGVYYNLVGHDTKNVAPFSINYSWNGKEKKCTWNGFKGVTCAFTNGGYAPSIGENAGVLEIVVFDGKTHDPSGTKGNMGIQFNGNYPTALLDKKFINDLI